MIEPTNEPVQFDPKIVDSLNSISDPSAARRGKSPKFHALHIREATKSMLLKLFEEPSLSCSPNTLEAVCKFFLDQSKCEPIEKVECKRLINRYMVLEASEKSYNRCRRRNFDVERYLGSKFAFITSIDPPSWAKKTSSVVENYVTLLIAAIKDVTKLEKIISNLKSVLIEYSLEQYSWTWLTFVLYLVWDHYKLLKLKTIEPKFNKQPVPTNAACEPIYQKFNSSNISSEELDSFTEYFQSIPVKKGKQTRADIIQKLFTGSFSFSQTQVTNMLVQDRFGNRLLDIALFGISQGILKSHGERNQFLERFFSVSQDAAVKAQYIKDLAVNNLNSVMLNTHPQTKKLRKEVPHPIFSELGKVPEIAKYLGLRGQTSQICYFPDQSNQLGYYKQILELIRTHPKSHEQAVLTRKLFANRVDYSNDIWKQLVENLEFPYIHMRIASKLMSNTFARHLTIAIYQFYLSCRHKLSQKDFLASKVGTTIQQAFLVNFEYHKKANFLFTLESANKDSLISVLRGEDFLFSCIAYYNIFEDVTPFKDCLASFANLPALDDNERTFDKFTTEAAKSVLIDNIDDILESPQMQSVSQIATVGNAIYLSKFARKIFHHSLMSGLLTEKTDKLNKTVVQRQNGSKNQTLISLDLLRALAGQQTQTIMQKHFTIAAHIRALDYSSFKRRSSAQFASRNAKRLCQYYTLLKSQINAEKQEIYELLLCSNLTNSIRWKHSRNHGSYFFEGLVQPWLAQAKFGNLVQELLELLIGRLFNSQLYWSVMWFIGRFYPKSASNNALQNYCSAVLKLTIQAAKKLDPESEIESNNRYLGSDDFKKVLEHIHSQYTGGPIQPNLLVEIYNLQNPNKFAQVVNTSCFTDHQKLEFLLKSIPDVDSRRLPEVYEYMKMPNMNCPTLRSICESYRLDFSDLEAVDIIKKLNSLSNFDFARVAPKLIANKPLNKKPCIFVAPIMVRSLRRFAACVLAVKPEEWQDVLFIQTQEITEDPEVSMILTDYISCFWRPLVSILAESVSLHKGYYTKEQGKRQGGPWTAENLSLLRESGKFYGPSFAALLQEVDLLDRLHPKENIKQAILSFINQVSKIAVEHEELLKSIVKTSVDDYGVCGPFGEGFPVAKERSDQPFPSMKVKVYGSDEEGQPLKENDQYFSSIKKLADLRSLIDSINSVNTIKVILSIEDKRAILQDLIGQLQGGNFTYQDVFAAVALSFFASDDQQRRDLHGSLSNSKSVEQVMAGYLKTAFNSGELKKQPGFRPEAFQSFEQALSQVRQTNSKLFPRPMKSSEELLMYGTLNILSCLQASDMNAMSSDLGLMSKINKHICSNPKVIADTQLPLGYKCSFRFSQALIKQVFSNETEGHLTYQRICLATEKIFAQIEDHVQLINLTSRSPKLNISSPKEVSNVILTCKADRQGGDVPTEPTRSTLLAEFDPTVPYGKSMLPHVRFIDGDDSATVEKKVSFVIGTRIHPSYSILSSFCEELGELTKEIKADYGEEALVALVLSGKDPFSTDALRQLVPQKQELFSVPEANFKYQFKIATELIKMQSVVQKLLDSAFAEVSHESLTRDLLAAHKRDLGFSSVSEWYDRVYGPVPKPAAKPQQAKKK